MADEAEEAAAPAEEVAEMSVLDALREVRFPSLLRPVLSLPCISLPYASFSLFPLFFCFSFDGGGGFQCCFTPSARRPTVNEEMALHIGDLLLF